MTPRETNADLLAEITALRDRVASLTRENAEFRGTLGQASHREAATSEILRVISSSPTDLQPVFDAIAQSTVRLCEAARSTVWRPEGDLFRAVARCELTPEGHVVSAPRGEVLDADSLPSRAIRERQILRVNDVPENPAVPPKYRERARLRGYRSLMVVPMMREGLVVGVITVVRPASVEFSDQQVALVKTFGDQAVIAIENVRLFNETKEALERQTATSEILRVISSSPTDVQPVLDAVAESAARLCGATDSLIMRVDAGVISRAAHFRAVPSVSEARPVTPHTPTGRAIVERRVIHIHDILEEFARGEYEEARALQHGSGFRTVLCVPLMREDAVIGVIVIRRLEARPFAEKEVELVNTFADQAVIAIENVRLFNETKEALDRQTATGEILRVIASSATDVQPVFDAIVQSATRLCDAAFGIAFQFDGHLVTPVAHHKMSRDEELTLSAAISEARLPATRRTVAGRAVLEGRVVHIADIRDDPELLMPSFKNAPGYRTVLAVPMLRDGRPIGSINLWRRDVRPFSDKQIELLKTFADQAVIAIENVRLFKELETRNHDLTEALGRQTATAEILRIISQSQTEVQPVFDAIVDNAMRLFRAWSASVLRLDGELMHLIAMRGGLPGSDEYMRRQQSPRPIYSVTPAGRCVATRTVVHIHDVESDPTLDQPIRDMARTRGWKSELLATHATRRTTHRRHRRHPRRGWRLLGSRDRVAPDLCRSGSDRH
jgi:two-component system NtrC family sensor kinase